MTFHSSFKTRLGKVATVLLLPVLFLAAQSAFAQSAEVRSMGVYYIDTDTTPEINEVYCNWDIGSTRENDSYYKGGIVNVEGKNTSDPWQTSALIEYDQPYPSPTTQNKYPNHCLSLCMDVYCTNKPNGAATYSVSFPIQNVRFEIAKYYGSKDIVNPDTNPAVRTIDMSLENNYIVGGVNSSTNSVNLENFMCASYTCYGASADWEKSSTCPNPIYECNGAQSTAKCKELTDTEEYASPADWPFTASNVCGSDFENGEETPCIVRSAGTGKGYNEPIRFCTAWDGSYEILGEFGKMNGQYGVRGTIHTDYPGDGIAVENITIDQTFTYPGNNQFPIQVDVTNVHTVRSTPSVVGSITAVPALPYTMTYRLSKDANVEMKIFDASSLVRGQGSCLAISPGVPQNICENNMGGTWWTDPCSGKTGCCSPSNYDPNGATACGIDGSDLVRTLVDWQPRLGEGFKGSDNDKLIIESESWDGRDDNGRLLPANNYILSIQAKTEDEWPGVDLSRAVTRQVSIDPLKLTDIQVTGLTKQSTAYATIRYVPTEASNVYFEVYSPGTTFDSIDTVGSDPTGTSPTVTAGTGVRVYRSEQQRGRAASYPDKWDGLCHEAGGCAIIYPEGAKDPISGSTFTATTTVNFAENAPLPDGDYVYVLWAEIPYTDTYTDKSGRIYTGVKTLKYYTGILPVERGVVDITIQPVSYSTIGSSPTAYGLDPFIFKYSIARDALVNAYVKNSAGVIVRTLTKEGGNTNVAQQMNTLTWDGRDDLGRMVGSGTYMFVVQTQDPMFPSSVKTQASVLFPVDMYRVVNVSTTDVYGDSDARATISYYLSKAMNVLISIYSKDVVIPVVQDDVGSPTYYWPPRICNKTDDATHFDTSGAVDPSTHPQCIYVNDSSFTVYPPNRTAAEYDYEAGPGTGQTLHVRLQPIKTFNRSSLKPGEGVAITEEWDAQYFYNPTSVACAGGTDVTACDYETVPDGVYPFYIAAQTEEPMSLYYDPQTGEPLRAVGSSDPQNGLYATDKISHRINITRGPVYFLDGTTAVYPNAPQLFNTSSGPVFVPPYEINFAISRAATVEVAIVALKPNMCTMPQMTGSVYDPATNPLTYNTKAGEVCKYLSTMTIVHTPNFDPNIIRKVYWDGTDHNGLYVRNGNYEIRLTAKNYPDEQLYQPTVKQMTSNIDILRVFDLPESESYAINKRGTDMKISYQLSVPMKVAIQIFKPGTTIFDYQKGTLRDPATGLEVTDIRDVLVKTIVGIRPSTTLIEEVWDGTDYAGQEVPDGTYPFRFVTALNSADIDTITGEITSGSDASGSLDPKINYVADTYQYTNLHHATVAIGDGEFVCEDWEKTVFFYPNPFKSATGTLEVTKMPVPGTMSIKMYNLAGDLVREGGYTCVDANNYTTVMGNNLEVAPDNTVSNTQYTGGMPNVRNAALRCFWDKTNDHGKRVARGVYFGLVDFRAQNGRQHCQKVVKILIPR